jgi:hypothetical protein
MVCSARDEVRGVADVVGLPLLASWDVPGLGPLSGLQTKTRACHSKVQRPCFPRNDFLDDIFCWDNLKQCGFPVLVPLCSPRETNN